MLLLLAYLLPLIPLLLGLCLLIQPIYILLVYQKTVGAIKGEAISGKGSTKHLVIEFTPVNNNMSYVYTVLNTSCGKKDEKRVVYYDINNPKKVYATSWFDFVIPALLLLLGLFGVFII